MAQKNSESYYRLNVNLIISASASIESQLPRDNQIQEETLAPVAAVNTKCFSVDLTDIQEVNVQQKTLCVTAVERPGIMPECVNQ